MEGFLHGSGLVLIHHPGLWQLLDNWIVSLTEPLFTGLLPLLRRTFSTFPAPERRQIGEKASQDRQLVSAVREVEVDPARVEKALALVVMILKNE